MRRVLLAVALGGLGFLAAPAVPAWAACVPAGISVFPSSGPPESAFTITGQGFYSGCSDLLGTTTPDRGIRLELVQNGTTSALGTVDAGAGGSFEHQARVPAGAPPGSATVRAVGTSSTQSAGFEVTSISGSTSSSVPRTTVASTTTTHRTSTTVGRTTTSSTEPSTSTIAPQPAPAIDFPTSTNTDPTVAAGRPRKGGGGGNDWGATPYIVAGIVCVGGAFAVVSARLYRHLGPPPPPP